LQRDLDATMAWALLVGSRPLGETDPISVPTAQLLAAWEVFREELLTYWELAVDRPAPGWPDPQSPGDCWAQLVLEQGMDDDEARRRLDVCMSWEPQ
jgi:hypothetical protein